MRETGKATHARGDWPKGWAEGAPLWLRLGRLCNITWPGRVVQQWLACVEPELLIRGGDRGFTSKCCWFVAEAWNRGQWLCGCPRCESSVLGIYAHLAHLTICEEWAVACFVVGLLVLRGTRRAVLV